MASEPTVGEGDGAREKQRYTENKVYTRKAFKGLKKKNNSTVVAAPETTTTALAAAPSATPTAAQKITETSNKNITLTYKPIRVTNNNNVTGNNDNDDNIPEKKKNDENIPKKKNNDNKNIPEKNNDNSIIPENKNDDNDIIPKSSNDVLERNNIPEGNNNNIPEENNNNIPEENNNITGNDNNNITDKDNVTIEDNDDNLTQPRAIAASEDGKSAQQEQLVSRSDAGASGDSSSPNRQEVGVGVVEPESGGHPPAENGVVKEVSESRVKINLVSRSKQEVRELRRKLESELDMVRGLVKRIEAKQGQIGGFSHSHVSANDGGLRRVHSEVASIGVPPREVTRPLHQLSISVLENSQGICDIVEKEKRTPKANQFYHNSEFLLAKDKFPPAESNKKSKLNGKKHGGGGLDLGQGYGMGSKFFKSCSSLLEKLMKHKHGWVFNDPVDAGKLGLHDYHIIIKHPMDLGTIKSRLNKNWYKSPKEFAEDVRLTFDNAMTYNPKGQDVHVMAEQLSRIFEDRWAIIESDYNREMRFPYDYGASLPTPTPRKAPPLPPPPLDMRRILDRSESISHHGDPKPKPMTITPRTPAPKKPKAKDPDKRDMTYEEKQKLSTNLQSLPSEKLDAIVQIIKRRNSSLFQHDDEIEVDIDSVDAETLWELDRFVTNYRKSLSKHKRKAELALQARAEAQQNVPQQTQAPIVAEVPKETKTDERIVSSSTPIQGDNQGDNRSRSSSSGSSSSDSGSSSSDSDSDSSSASGSDAGSPRT